MVVQSEHRSILVVDIEGFTRGDRTSPIQLELQQRLRRLLHEALTTAGISRRACRWHDTGDGFLVTIGPEVAKSRLLDQVVARLASGLDHHNHNVEPARRLRLRVVVHAGEVVRERQATVGGAVNLACRLLDAPELRACLATSSGSLVVAVSDWLYQEVVRHGYGGIDPAGYRPFRFTSKDLAGRAWVHAPGDPGTPDRAGVTMPADAMVRGASGSAIANLPPRNLAFTGRAELLDRLDQQLTTSVAAVALTALVADSPDPTSRPARETTGPGGGVAGPRVLHGLGGVGKTQLALEYAYRHADEYAIRWWVPAEQPAAIPAHLVALARHLGIPDHAEQTQTITALLGDLGHRTDWLLVFDNAEGPDDLRSYLPTGSERGGRLLVTSRNPNWQPLAATIPVNVLPRAEAITFLQRRLGLDHHDADALAEALGDLPLALEQAAAYQEQTHTPPREYLELLHTRARELFALGRPATSEQTITTTWTVSLQRLREHAPVAEDLLALCAFLAPDDIPRQLLEDYPDRLPERLATVRDPLGMRQALGALRRYSLVSLTADAISIHRLVQAVVRQSLNAEIHQHWAATAVELLAAAFPEQANNADTWPVAARLLPHALTVTARPTAAEANPEKLVDLLNRMGDYLWGRAEYEQARLLLDHALAVAEHHLGADHLHTAHSLDNLARVLRVQGELDTARALHQRALPIYEARLGPDHPDAATSLHNLAHVLVYQGELDTARALHQRALTIYEDRLGPDHPSPPIAWTTSPGSCTHKASSIAPASCSSAPSRSARPGWAPTTPRSPGASTTSPPSSTRKATSIRPASCSSAPSRSARPGWAPTTPSPQTASMLSPASCATRATSTKPARWPSVPFASTRPAWVPTTPRPQAALTPSPKSSTTRATSTQRAPCISAR
jgi:tetratricopeptide (TPR) repeat protein